MLRVVLPKGSLEKATLELFEQADLGVVRGSDVHYRATIDDPRVLEVKILRPQEIAGYVESGLFDLGVTGRDWIEEPSADVVSLGELEYSKATDQPVRIVLAVADSSPVQSVADLAQASSPVRVATEYPSLTRRYLEAQGVKAEIMLSYGATEAKIPDIADVVVDMTETGGALRAAKLRIIATILVSHTEVIANHSSYADGAKRHAMEQIYTLLQGTLEARGKVLVKLNVAEVSLQAVIDLLPAMKSPTVSKLFGGSDYAVEAVVPKSVINVLIPDLKDAGATDIIELPLSKIVH